MNTLRIFISSPGDVRDERQIAGKVIERIQGKYWSFVRLDDVFWEEKVVRATAHYQDELINPGRCEIVVGVLWSRLGSPLPAKFQKQAGLSNTTGTEWELEEAFSAYESSLAVTGDSAKARPDILIYRRGGTRPTHGDPKKDAEAADQETALNRYLDANYFHQDEHHTIKRPIASYQTPEEFEKKLAGDLEQLVLRCIPSLKPGYEPPPISGSPFKGLHAFDFSDSDRYFGRNREIREIQERLRSRAAKGLPFVLIYGGSGYGKSSLMRAGLAPVITRTGGSTDGIGMWRRVALQPSLGQGPLCERLARALFQTVAPEELEYARLHGDWPLPGLREIAETPQEDRPGQMWDLAGFSRCLADEEGRAFAILGIQQTLERLDRHLLLQIDQLEEIFTTQGITDGRDAFFRAIGDLCLTGRVWCVATLRSEYFPRIAEESVLRDLVGRDGGYILAPPDRQSLREIIRFPALAARLDYQRRIGEVIVAGESAKYEFVDEQILADAEISADALPLLEFTLQRLYDQRADDLLTWDAYAAFGGLKGAIAHRANDVYLQLSPIAWEARHAIFASLVRVDALGGTVVRQRAPLGNLRAKPGAGEFLDAFLAAHLLVTDEEAGKPVVTFAHEALISHWDELSEWTVEHRSDLLARQRLREQTELWLKNDTKKSYLLSEGRLAEAQRVAANSIFHLTDDEKDYLRLSGQRARGRLRFFQVAAAVFALLAIGAGVLGWFAKTRADLAKAETRRAEAETKHAEGESKRAEAETKRAEGENARNRKLLRAESMADLAAALNAWQEDFDVAQKGQRAAGFQGKSKWHEAVALLARALESEPTNGRAAEWLYSMLLYRGHAKRDWSILTLRHTLIVDDARFSSDGSMIMTVSGATASVWNASTGRTIAEPFDTWHVGSSIAFSPDGTKVVTAGESGTAQIWDTASRKPIGPTMSHRNEVWSAAFSSDGKRLVTTSGRAAQVWNASTGSPIGPVLRCEWAVNSASFSPDGGRIVTTSGDSAQVWSIASGKRVSEMRHRAQINNAVFSPDGTMVATASHDHTAQVWNSNTGKPIGKPLQHDAIIYSAFFSPDGDRVVTASEDGAARVWNVTSGEPTCGPLRHAGFVKSAVFNSDGTRVVTASSDNTARIWNATSGEEVGEPMHHEGQVNSARFNSDGTRVVTASWDETARVWDATTGAEVDEPIRFPGPNGVEDFSSDATRFLTTNFHGSAQVWGALTGKPIGGLIRGEVCRLSLDGTRVVAVDTDHSVRVWDTATGRTIGVPFSHEGDVSSVNFSPDGTRVVTAGNHNAQVWDAETGKAVGAPFSHEGDVTSVGFSSDGTRVVTVGNHTAEVWDAATGKMIGARLRHKGDVSSASFSPDGSRVLTTTSQGDAEVWDVSTGKATGGQLSDNHYVNSACFSPDGTRVVTGGLLKTAQVWNASTGRPIGEPMRHDDDVAAAVFSPDGARILTISAGIGRVWDADTGKAIGEPMRHEDHLIAARFSPNGAKVLAVSGGLREEMEAGKVVAGSDGIVWIWDAGTGQERNEISRVSQQTLEWVRAIAGLAFDQSGELLLIPDHERRAVINKPQLPPGPWADLANWLTSPAPVRALSPTSKYSVREIAERERDFSGSGTIESLISALRYDSTVPLARLLLAEAKEKKNERLAFDHRDAGVAQEAAFLRRYDLDRLIAESGKMKHEEAAALWARAAEILLLRPEAKVGVGLKVTLAKNEALKAAERALALDPKNAKALQRKGKALEVLKHPENIKPESEPNSPEPSAANPE